jgi:phospholipid/cholesterol/gamma-HCH transport system substrate-binding protein
MKKYSMETTVGVFLVIGLLCVGYLTVKLGDVTLLGDGYSSFFARFTSVAGLRTGSSVEIFGIEVGKVGKLTMDQESQMALVEVRIKKDVIIYKDAIASIKTAGLIGDKYIQIDPGGSEEVVKPGGIISETTSPMDIEELISKYAFGSIGKGDEKRGETKSEKKK